MITLDTSAVFALLNRRDPAHLEVRQILEGDPGPYLLPAGILAEATYLIEDRLGARVLDAFLNDIETGAITFDGGESDWPRIRELVVRYADLPLGAADASVVACAERAGGVVLTLDQRDFSVVSKEGRLKALPVPRIG